MTTTMTLDDVRANLIARGYPAEQIDEMLNLAGRMILEGSLASKDDVTQLRDEFTLFKIDVAERFAELRTEMYAGFAEMNVKFVEVNAKFAEQNASINAKFAEMDANFAEEFLNQRQVCRNGRQVCRAGRQVCRTECLHQRQVRRAGRQERYPRKPDFAMGFRRHHRRYRHQRCHRQHRRSRYRSN